jgi:hypothetical protein
MVNDLSGGIVPRGNQDMRKHVGGFTRRFFTLGLTAGLALACVMPAAAQTGAQRKPNILVIWGDDIGYWNISAYNQGMMGYKTPNATLKEYPPSQKVGSFSLDQVLEKLQQSASSGK